jgi:hypothetical protein
VADQLDRCRRRHDWGDPFLGAWAAYSIARDNGVEVPDWTSAYFRRVAVRISEISRKKPDRDTLGMMVLRALEITRRGGPGVFSRRAKAQRDAALAEHVRDLVADGVPVKRATLEVADARKIHPELVDRAWRRSYPRRNRKTTVKE